MNHNLKRPYLSDESESQANHPLKTPRFLSPNSLTIHHASPLAVRPTDSTSALTSQAQEQKRLQDCPDYCVSFHGPLSSQSPPREHPSKKLSTSTNETPGCIKRVHRVTSLGPIDKSTTNEANKSADTANQSGSTLVGSTSEPSMSLFVFSGLEILRMS